MKAYKIIIAIGLLAAPAMGDEKGRPEAGLVGYREYQGLLGEDFSGNVFIIRYNGRLVACM